MKRLTFLIGLVSMLLIGLSGCSTTNSNETKVTANTSFTLQVGKTAVLKEEGISIKFDSVSADSRCPTGVICIWAGEAQCKMLVTQNGQTRPVILTQPGSSESSVSDFVGSYQVSFQLNPYPKSGSQIAPQDYILSLKLFK